MPYQSLYRKYRSQTFSDLVGQGHVVRTLQNAISAGKISHSYLFTGPRGTGKTSAARLLAKALCCENGPTPEPDNTCDICAEITAGSFVDVVEMDAASESKVDEIREHIVDAVEYRPMIGRYKVYIIDEVHDLSAKAFDALLKTIEEPPDHAIFILATTEVHKVPPTIRSRCQNFEFRRGSVADIRARLIHVSKSEGFELTETAALAIARLADGGFRDALTILEQAIISSDSIHIDVDLIYGQFGIVPDDLIDALLEAMQGREIEKVQSQLDSMFQAGWDPRSVVDSLVYRLSVLSRSIYQSDATEVDAGAFAASKDTAARLGADWLMRLRAELGSVHRSLREVTLPRLWLEGEFIRLTLNEERNQSSLRQYKPADRAPSPAAVVQSARSERQPAAVPEAGPPEQATDGSLQGKLLIAVERVSPTLRLKLIDATLIEESESTFTLSFRRSIDLEWIQKRDGAFNAIQTALAEVVGHVVELVMRHDKPPPNSLESNAVELELVGEDLVQGIYRNLPVTRSSTPTKTRKKV